MATEDGYKTVTITNGKGSRSMKKSILMQILYKEYRENEMILANYKTLNIKYKLQEKGISNSLFKVLLSELTKEGYIKRLKKGYYKLTEQGIMFVMLGGNHLGVSPPLVTQSNNQKVVKDLLDNINLISIRLHNIKAKFSIKQLNPSKISKDGIVKDVYFTGQILYSKEHIQPTILLHIHEVKGSNYNDAIVKLYNVIEKIKYVLAKKYEIYIDEMISLYQEYAFVFKFPEELENFYKKIVRFVTIDGIRIQIDESTGLWEIEASHPDWVVYFIASPILVMQNTNMLLVANARLFELKESIEGIKNKILNINNMDSKDVEFILKKLNMLENKLNSLENDILELKPIISDFAKNVKIHLGVMQGMFGMLATQTEIFNEFRLLLEKLNEKLDKIK